MNNRLTVYGAFAAIYLIWGSTYLAIALTVRDVPPVFMVAVRGLLAGVVLYGWVRCRGGAAITAREISATVPTASLLFGGGYVLVGWAEQHIVSGTAALLNATTPAWVVLFEWLTRRRARPAARFVVALALGLSGVGLLVSGRGPSSSVPLLPAAALVLASMAWAAGTLRAGAHANGDPVRAAAVQLLTGGLLLLPLSIIVGEGDRILNGLATSSLLALAYLVVAGSLVGYSAYVWLLHHVAAAKVASHAYVNPLFAVLIGAALGDEHISPTIMGAALLILLGVFFIVRDRAAASTAREIVRPSPRPRIAA